MPPGRLVFPPVVRRRPPSRRRRRSLRLRRLQLSGRRFCLRRDRPRRVRLPCPPPPLGLTLEESIRTSWCCSRRATWRAVASRLLRSRSSTCGTACRRSKWLVVPPRGRCMRRGTPRRTHRLAPSELEAVRREVTDLQRRLGEVEDQGEALEEGALAVFRVVEPHVPMGMDELHALPDAIRSSVRLGIRRGATAALAAIHLRTETHLGGVDPGFPETSSASSRRQAMRDFAGFGRVTAAEMDVDDLLRRGADPELDGP